MSKAHANSVLALKGVSVPLDNNTYAYWNFEKNIVSGITPLIPIVKYQNVITNPNTKADIMTTGKFGNGVMINEATTNLLYDAGVINWTISNLATTVTRTTLIENSKYQIVSGASAGTFRFYVPLSKLTNGATYTLSYKYKIVSGTTFSMGDWNDTTITKYDVDYGTYKFSAATGSRATYDATFRFMDFNISGNTTVEIWDVQLEQKDYATEFTTGIRYQTNLKYPLSIVNNHFKTISFWFKSNSNKNLSSISRALMSQTDASGELSTSPFWYCAIPSTGDVLLPMDGAPGLRLYNGTNYACQSTINVLDGKWHFIVVELNVTAPGGYISRIWVDSFKSETAVYTNPIVATDRNLKIGYMGDENTTTEFSNCAYDEICLRTAHYSEDEIISWYLSEMPFYAVHDYTMAAE